MSLTGEIFIKRFLLDMDITLLIPIPIYVIEANFTKETDDIEKMTVQVENFMIMCLKEEHLLYNMLLFMKKSNESLNSNKIQTSNTKYSL